MERRKETALNFRHPFRDAIAWPNAHAPLCHLHKKGLICQAKSQNPKKEPRNMTNSQGANPTCSRYFAQLLGQYKTANYPG